MKKLIIGLAVLAVAFCMVFPARSDQTDGRIFVPSEKDKVSWNQIGKAGAWKQTIAGAACNGRIYTVETSGVLYNTDPSNGIWTQVGTADFAATKYMFAAGNRLLTIEQNGSLYDINPADGKWKAFPQEGGWKNTIAGTTGNGVLYTVESTGILYSTDLKTGNWTQIGKPDFAKTAFLFHAGNKLYSIETDGSLYQIDPKTGLWERKGDPQAWKETIAGVVLNDKIYTIETTGSLFVTDPQTGTWSTLGNPEYANTRFMFASGGKLYTIESDGNLFELTLR